MNSAEQKRVIILPIILLLGAGIALAGSYNGQKSGGIPIFVICVAVSFVIQWIAFILAYRWQTEKFYDLTGSITYLTLLILSFLLTSNLDTRSVFLLLLIGLWTLRLGSFLFRRVLRSGGDRRFDEIKVSFIRFLSAWTLQGLWVVITISAALAALTSSTRQNLGVLGILGILLWVVGFGIEVVADRQKSVFRSSTENKDKFINTGLWAWSRHPNYFGEIVLWLGITVLALPVLRGWQFITLISPLFVIFLLTKVSGIPLLEKSADKRWGDLDEYQQYKEKTPVLIPRPPQ